MKFNSANYIENGYLLRGVPYIEFAVESGLKNTIGSEKSIAMDSEINIQLVSAKYFFWMVQKKGFKGYLWILHVSTSDCGCCKIGSSTKQK